MRPPEWETQEREEIKMRRQKMIYGHAKGDSGGGHPGPPPEESDGENEVTWWRIRFAVTRNDVFMRHLRRSSKTRQA